MESLSPPAEKPLFPCEQCFSTKGTLKQHLRCHTGECPFACGKRFGQSGNLRSHEKTCSSILPLGRKDETLDEDKIAFNCDVCSDRFPSLSDLEGHKKSHPEPKKKFRCSECPYSSYLKGNLDRHLLTHSGERPFQCELCDKAFTTKAQLTRHLLVHTGERPYVCETCGKGFRERYSLHCHGKCHLPRQRHLLTHSGKRLFQCKFCGQKFGDNYSLHRHEATHGIRRGKCHVPRHSPTEPKKKFRCTECPYSTDSKQRLELHLLTHSGERPHQCELCDKAFIYKTTLQRHLLVHTGERPYVCDTCGKGFREKSKLHRHEAICLDMERATWSPIRNSTAQSALTPQIAKHS